MRVRTIHETGYYVQTVIEGSDGLEIWEANSEIDEGDQVLPDLSNLSYSDPYFYDRINQSEIDSPEQEWQRPSVEFLKGFAGALPLYVRVVKHDKCRTEAVCSHGKIIGECKLCEYEKGEHGLE